MKERVRGKKRDDEGNKGNKNKTKKKVATQHNAYSPTDIAGVREGGGGKEGRDATT